ncbi:unnamed protein product [Brassica oleracea]|nr:unnamed protein product [Brassica napus]
MMGTRRLTFAAIGGVYIGVEQVVQNYRAKRDFSNGDIGGLWLELMCLDIEVHDLSYSPLPSRSIPTAIAAGATLAGTSALIYSGDQKTRVDNGSREYYPYTPV